MEPGFFQITLKVILVKGRDFLILRDAQTQRGDLPGGRLAQAEFYEPWANSLNRELCEELGPNVQYTLHEDPLFYVPHRIHSAQTDTLGILYRATYHSGTVVLSDEHDHFAWVSLDNYDPTDFFTRDWTPTIRQLQGLSW